jgi:hypothetical protein
MDLGRFRRRTIALVAAYAVALQALLTAFVPVAPAVLAVPFAGLCAHDQGDGTGQPAQHDLPCAALCAAMGHGISGPVPPGVVAAIVVPYGVTARGPVSEWVPPQIPPTDTHAPRGPPPDLRQV